jgi:hypothetical protein
VVSAWWVNEGPTGLEWYAARRLLPVALGVELPRS